MTDRKRHFERLYRREQDPWGFETSPYENRKYAATLASLPRRRYAACLEVGCSIGVLSQRLALRCERFLGIDLAADAVARARARAYPGGNADFRVAEVPRQWPSGRYDLIVLSEVLYYLSPAEIGEVVALVARDLAPCGNCLLVNWLGATGTALSGDDAVGCFEAAFGSAAPLHATMRRREPTYRIDLFSAPPD